MEDIGGVSAEWIKIREIQYALYTAQKFSRTDVTEHRRAIERREMVLTRHSMYLVVSRM